MENPRRIYSVPPGEFDRVQAEMVGPADIHFVPEEAIQQDYEDPLQGTKNLDIGAHGEHHPDLGKYLRRGAIVGAVAVGTIFAYGAVRRHRNRND